MINWTLSKETSWEILVMGVSLEVDLFADARTAMLPELVTCCIHMRSADLDAVGMDWNRYSSVYLFPPVALLLEVIWILGSCRYQVHFVASF